MCLWASLCVIDGHFGDLGNCCFFFLFCFLGLMEIWILLIFSVGKLGLVSFVFFFLFFQSCESFNLFFFSFDMFLCFPGSVSCEWCLGSILFLVLLFSFFFFFPIM